ncbi:MAG: hypothetical protein ACLP8S_31795 [Solirubrobacteraceae bacterium]
MEPEPGRDVGTEVEDLDDEVSEEKLAAAQAELGELAARAAVLERSADHASRNCCRADPYVHVPVRAPP